MIPLGIRSENFIRRSAKWFDSTCCRQRKYKNFHRPRENSKARLHSRPWNLKHVVQYVGKFVIFLVAAKSIQKIFRAPLSNRRTLLNRFSSDWAKLETFQSNLFHILYYMSEGYIIFYYTCVFILKFATLYYVRIPRQESKAERPLNWLIRFHLLACPELAVFSGLHD